MKYESKKCKHYRVAFISTHPIQYTAPLFAYLTKYCDVEATALYLSDFSLRDGHDRGFGRAITWDIDLLKGYTAHFIEGASRRRLGGFFSMVAPQLWQVIRKGGFDAVVIHGHNLAAHHVALLAAKMSGIPAFARGETHLGLKRARWRAAVRTPLLKAWYRFFDAFLAIGTQNRAYYEAMGVPASKIFMVPYAVDNDRFITEAQLNRNERNNVRARLGILDEAPAILYAAKFDLRKRPADLINAFFILRRAGLDANLVMAGTGALEKKLRQQVASLGLDKVSFPGFINQGELPQVYASCDVFALPSENEPWGLAVNEAMCASLPIVLSEEIGCSFDLVTDGVNGAKFTAGDVNGLAEALMSIVSDPELRARYGQASLRRITEWGFRECGRGLRRAVAASRPKEKDGHPT